MSQDPEKADPRLTKVIWRDWFNAAAVAQMEAMKTLPREEIMIDCRSLTGNEVAAEIARKTNEQDSTSFREGGQIVIIDPKRFAGAYKICVDYEPTFYAYTDDSNE